MISYIVSVILEIHVFYYYPNLWTYISSNMQVFQCQNQTWSSVLNKAKSPGTWTWERQKAMKEVSDNEALAHVGNLGHRGILLWSRVGRDLSLKWYKNSHCIVISNYFMGFIHMKWPKNLLWTLNYNYGIKQN